ncbi:MAG: guanylate kinase [Clostridia bacterium]|nr:guanylate kinase [Clostridia bacterium]
MQQPGLLLVVSGPAGSGKGTVNQELLKTGDFDFSVSATTRAPRPGEVDGVHYHFISREDFTERIRRGEMLEYTEYVGNYYGTPLDGVRKSIAAGRNMILEIELEGARHVKEKYPDAVLVILLPVTFKTQEERLRKRGTEPEEKIRARLERTKEEMKYLDVYDYIVYNRDGCAKDAVNDLLAIVRAEKCKTSRHPDAADKYFEKS